MGTSEDPGDEDTPLTGEDLSTWGRACLEGSTRDDIYQLVRRLPGLNKSQTADEMDLHKSTVNTHLEIMAAYEVIEIRDGARPNEKLCFAAPDAHLWRDERTRILFGRDPIKHIGIHLAHNPGDTVADVAAELDLDPAAVYPHMRTLEEHGLIEVEPIGGSKRHRATPVLEAWVDEVGGAYAQHGSQA